MWLQWKLIGCDNLHRSEALHFFRRWRSERREKDMDGHEEESEINDFQLHLSGKFEHRNTGKIPHRLGKLRESMIVALSAHRIHQDPNCSYSSIHPIASHTGMFDSIISIRFLEQLF
ncbi:unnamed protein product [Brassica oleracea]